MTYIDILNSELRYFDIISDSEFIKTGSIVLKNSNMVDSFIGEVNFTLECYGINERLERGFNVNSFGDLVIISPFKRWE